ncbi:MULTISPECIES: HAD family hydrolase [unclassified Fusibacter]|uniref:HAD family hydrolase n=1 Tax=unclassified Fusibacter TaxID=2624464 RepID=UPI0013E961EE|nr:MULTISPECIES: HAD family hydrolase [unclassified Fusibacter]MCK8058243.1 HAD hydrolase family protein [Fusibacter sp. A2]NPE20826.1 hypothetical protein [Fusibacter sp. A1]
MKVFASDLDQTLIFSKRWIPNVEEELKCIERYGDGGRSYMLEEAERLLLSIQDEFEFVPVTTRTREQYDRIAFEVEPQYAICCNGGVVLIDGEPDEKWDRAIAKKMEGVRSLSEVKKTVENAVDEYDGIRIRTVEQLFLYVILKDKKLAKQVEICLAKVFSSTKWSIYQHGSKVYVMPKFLTKASALSYLLEKLDAKKTVTSGDSRLDFGMREVSDWFITPGHVDFSGDYNCDGEGLESGLETLTEAYRYLSRKN